MITRFRETEHKTGWVEVICGVMFSGKTEELIRRIKRAIIAKQKVKVFKPEIDNRYNPLLVNSHSGFTTEAVSIKFSKDILRYLDKEIDVVAIDEVQFFDQDIVSVIEDIAAKGIRVIVTGLDMDFRGEPFGLMPNVLCLAEYVDKLQAICVKCAAPATRTQRLINGQPASYDDPVILVGASDSYEPRCRKCHEVAFNSNSLKKPA